MGGVRVAVLVDLPRGKGAGGHVKYWERMAQAAVAVDRGIDLTVYFSGKGICEPLSPTVVYCYLPPVFSTQRLGFLPYVPAHTDLAPFHFALAKELETYDVIHTTDAYFAFARTAEKVAKKNGIPLVSSFHTDTPAYAEVFTRQTLSHLFGEKFGGWVDRTFGVSIRERRNKENRLALHVRQCAAVFALRFEDKDLALRYLPDEKIRPMRLGVDKTMFAPDKTARNEIICEYGLPAHKLLTLFVGRVDVGKNMPLLLNACEIAQANAAPLHLIVVGQGPLCEQVRQKLGENVTLAGVLPPEKLARLYAGVDCLSMVSDIEIGGLVGVEALSCGCPVLVSKKSGIKALCGGTPAIKEVDSHSQAWATVLEGFARNRAELDKMGQAALDYRQDRLTTWNEVYAQDFASVWKDVARKG